MDRPRIVEILERTKETPQVTTIRFNDGAKAAPGQYYMIWVPGVDEIPMSLCGIGQMKEIAVHAKGEATRALVRMEPGERIGIRGPYGRGFTPKKGKAMVVGGGTGIACLTPLVETLAKKGATPMVVIGAKTASELLFVERNRRLAEVAVTTDDGTEGRKGFATDAVYALLNTGGYRQIYACGPELMMKKVVALAGCQPLPVQVSLERYMKCGVGICDSCAMGGFHICVEGPVLDGSAAMRLPEFGAFRRDACGRKEKL